MKKISAFMVPSLIGLALVAPFAALDHTNDRATGRNSVDFAVLFGLLRLLATAFAAILSSVVRGWREDGGPVNLLFRIACLILIAAMWSGIISDQLPCFLGIPNCD